jgi:hypothetical protein
MPKPSCVPPSFSVSMNVHAESARASAIAAARPFANTDIAVFHRPFANVTMPANPSSRSSRAATMPPIIPIQRVVCVTRELAPRMPVLPANRKIISMIGTASAIPSANASATFSTAWIAATGGDGGVFAGVPSCSFIAPPRGTRGIRSRAA